MLYVKPFAPFDVPQAVAICPECSAALRVEPFQYYEDDGTMDGASIHLICTMDTDGIEPEPGQFEHRCYQSDWATVDDAVERWMLASVRVRESQPTL